MLLSLIFELIIVSCKPTLTLTLGFHEIVLGFAVEVPSGFIHRRRRHRRNIVVECTSPASGIVVVVASGPYVATGREQQISIVGSGSTTATKPTADHFNRGATGRVSKSLTETKNARTQTRTITILIDK